MRSRLKMEWIQALSQSISDLEGKSADYLISTPWREPKNVGTHVVDLGGSNLRIATVDTSGPFKVKHIYTQLVDDQCRKNPLDWLASVILKADLPSFVLCWAFPLKDGNLCPMGKGWELAASDLHQPLVNQLNTRLGKMQCVLAVHDAIASLVAENAEDPHCQIALTWGTGINIAYRRGSKVINSEIGMCANPPYGLSIKKEKWDEELLKQVPGNMPFEYITGGAYLGRLYSIATGTNIQTNELWDLLDSDSIANRIVDRACFYVASAIHAVAKYLDSQDCTVAYTGGVIFEPSVFARLNEKLCVLSNMNGLRVKLVPQRFGPEIGAALLL